jgi:hypothetical protein
MLDDLNERFRCFHTRAGFEKLAGAESLTEHELRRLFILHREALERLLARSMRLLRPMERDATSPPSR